MSHDVLCPSGIAVPDSFLAWAPECVCPLIAQVRADEQGKQAHTCDGNNCCMGTPE